MNKINNCPHCGTRLGKPHKNDCDVERCSECEGQHLQCNREGHDPPKSACTGEWPRSRPKRQRKHTSISEREALQDWLDDIETDDNADIDDLLGRLWHSTDILPAGYCSQLDLPQGSSYAAASQKIAAERKLESWAANIMAGKQTKRDTKRKEENTRVVNLAQVGLQSIAKALEMLGTRKDSDAVRLRTNIEAAKMHLEDIWGS